MNSSHVGRFLSKCKQKKSEDARGQFLAKNSIRTIGSAKDKDLSALNKAPSVALRYLSDNTLYAKVVCFGKHYRPL